MRYKGLGPMPLIECVPNISEGRRPDVVQSIVDSLRKILGARVLDVSSDASHNRSVITMVGDARAMKAAVLTLFDRALDSIDLRAHSGEHPRLGAVDVVPFVPIAAIAMEDCVALARDTAETVASRFRLPVFLYEAAATSPSRRNLADIRRGEFEGLAAKLALPEWAPDFGPSVPHPSAGATVIGARMPLIAFNVNLATDRLEIAREIAVTVRQSSGGLPAVKALGMSLANRGIVQVSMNLTNYQQTSIAAAFGAVKTAAAQHGVRVAESEIIGLVPAAALAGVDPGDLLLGGFSEGQILENRLADG
jgi:glutamate formiminotransferase / 5-formyltetrahydrofolate cyclo-ligase